MSSDGGQQLLERLETLRIENHMAAHKNGHANGHAGGLPNGTVQPQRNGTLRMAEMVRISIPPMEASRTSFPPEWGKTGVAFVYAVLCFVTTTVVISVVHERVPPKEHTPPLPDKFFDLFNRVEWAFSICEINGMLLVALWLLQWAVLKHRYGFYEGIATQKTCTTQSNPSFKRAPPKMASNRISVQLNSVANRNSSAKASKHKLLFLKIKSIVSCSA